VRRGLFASLLAGETRPSTRDAGFLDAAAREAARGVGLLEPAVRWCATAGIRIVVLEKSGFHNNSVLSSPSILLYCVSSKIKKPTL
jgi:hypothetical protein